MPERPKKDISITIRIDESTYQRIEDIVEQNDSTISYEVRKMIKYYFQNKKAFE